MKKFNFCFTILLFLATLFGLFGQVRAANSAIVALSESKTGDIYTISVTVDPNGTTVCSLFSSYDFDKTKLVVQSISLGDASYKNATAGSFDVSTINTNSSITANLGFPSCKTTSFTAFSLTAIAGSTRGDVLVAANSLSIMGGSDGMQAVDTGYNMPAVLFSTVVDTPAVTTTTETTTPTTTTPSSSSSASTSTKRTTKSTTPSTAQSTETPAGTGSVTEETPVTPNETVTEETTPIPVATAVAKTNKSRWPSYLFGIWGAIFLGGLATLLYKHFKPAKTLQSLSAVTKVPVVTPIPAQNAPKPELAPADVEETGKKEMPIFGPKGNFVYSDLKAVHAKHWA